MMFSSKRRSRSGTRSVSLFASAPPTASVEDAFAESASTVPGADAVPAATQITDPDAISVTARWLVLTTAVNRRFARSLLPDGLAVAELPQLAVWLVEPLSADSDTVGVPAGRLFAGMSCSCLLPGEQDETAFTSDLLVGAPLVDSDRDPFSLPELPHTSLSLVNGVGGMDFSISPADGSGRGLVGTVELSECGSVQTQLTPDWMACQSWRTDLIGAATGADASADLARTQWEVTRLSPIVTGSAVVECAEFGSRTYDLSSSTPSLDARYGFARVAIVGRQ